MEVYNAIPSQFKPPPRAAQLQYAEYFYNECTLWLSERRSASLTNIMKDSIEVEINLTAAKEKREIEGKINIPNNLLPLTHKRIGWTG